MDGWVMQTDLGERLRQADIDALLDEVSRCKGIAVNVSGRETLVSHVEEDKVLLGLQWWLFKSVSPSQTRLSAIQVQLHPP